MLRAALLASLALFWAGCNGNCHNLAIMLCDCLVTTADQDACKQQISSQESRFGASSADNALCGQLLNQCDCHTVGTPQGKVACGLARAPDGGTVGH